MHDMGVDEAQFWVAEGLGQEADGGKAQMVPQRDCARVGGQHQIELHCRKAQITRGGLGVGAHGGGHALPCGLRRGDIAAVADVVRSTGEVWFYIVGAQRGVLVTQCDKGGGGAVEPEGAGRVFGDIGIDGIGGARAKDGGDHGPNRGPIGPRGGAECDPRRFCCGGGHPMPPSIKRLASVA